MTKDEMLMLLKLKQEQARAASQTDELGFPVPPKGGSSTNSEAVSEFENKLNSAALGAMEGAKFNLGENIAGARAAVLGMNQGQDGTTDIFNYSTPMRERYEGERDNIRGMNQAAQEANPGAYGTGNIAGMTATGLASAPLATGKTLLGTMGRGAGIGGVEGALIGGGSADGVDVGSQVLKGTLVGMGAGGAAPAIVAGGGAIKNALKDPVTGVFDAITKRANTGKANRAIAHMLRKSGQNPDDIAQAVARAAREGQPEFRLMDAAGIPGRRQASGIARSGGEAADELADFLEKRQLGQGERVSGFVDEGFGVGGRTAKRAVDAAGEARDEAADVAYNAARSNAGPVNMGETLETIDDALRGVNSLDGGKTGLSETAIGRKLASIGKQIESNDYSTVYFDEVLETKQELGRAIASIKKRGEKVPPAVAKVYGKLDEALEGASPLYRSANDDFARASKVIAAADEGAQASRPSIRSKDAIDQFTAKTPEQQEMFRLGYGDDLLKKLENATAPTANKAKALQSPKRGAEAGAMTLDPDLYARRLARENQMWEVQNRALGGSRTAENLQDIAGTEGAVAGVAQTARSAANFQFGDAVANIARMLGPVARGENEATRGLIVQALKSSNPMEVLAPVLRSEAISQGKRRVIEALVRNVTREGLMQ